MSAATHPGPIGADLAWPDDAVEVGRVLGAWGVKGGIKVKAFASDPQALFSSRRWFIAAPEALQVRVAVTGVAKVAGPMPSLLRVTEVREQGDGVVAKTQELNDRDAAAAMAGARIFISRASFPTPSDDEFYWVDLIGAQVSNRQGIDLGQVAGLVETGPHCVLTLTTTNADAQPRMVPFVAAYVDQVDVAAKRIVVDWPADF